MLPSLLSFLPGGNNTDRCVRWKKLCSSGPLTCARCTKAGTECVYSTISRRPVQRKASRSAAHPAAAAAASAGGGSGGDAPERVKLSPSGAVGLAGAAEGRYLRAFLACFGDSIPFGCSPSGLVLALVDHRSRPAWNCAGIVGVGVGADRAADPCNVLRHGLAWGVVAVGALLSGECTGAEEHARLALRANLCLQRALQLMSQNGGGGGGGSGGSSGTGSTRSSSTGIGSGKEGGNDSTNDAAIIGSGNHRRRRSPAAAAAAVTPTAASAADFCGGTGRPGRRRRLDWGASSSRWQAGEDAVEAAPSRPLPQHAAVNHLLTVANLLEAIYHFLSGRMALGEDCLHHAVVEFRAGSSVRPFADGEGEVWARLEATLLCFQWLDGLQKGHLRPNAPVAVQHRQPPAEAFAAADAAAAAGPAVDASGTAGATAAGATCAVSATHGPLTRNFRHRRPRGEPEPAFYGDEAGARATPLTAAAAMPAGLLVEPTFASTAVRTAGAGPGVGSSLSVQDTLNFLVLRYSGEVCRSRVWDGGGYGDPGSIDSEGSSGGSDGGSSGGGGSVMGDGSAGGCVDQGGGSDRGEGGGSDRGEGGGSDRGERGGSNRGEGSSGGEGGNNSGNNWSRRCDKSGREDGSSGIGGGSGRSRNANDVPDESGNGDAAVQARDDISIDNGRDNAATADGVDADSACIGASSGAASAEAGSAVCPTGSVLGSTAAITAASPRPDGRDGPAAAAAAESPVAVEGPANTGATFVAGRRALPPAEVRHAVALAEWCFERAYGTVCGDPPARPARPGRDRLHLGFAFLSLWISSARRTKNGFYRLGAVPESCGQSEYFGKGGDESIRQVSTNPTSPPALPPGRPALTFRW
ncbi:unnamed protein product [Phaeothamnion confervicola]